ncbi:DUF2066 domain-containing protein [Rhizobium sp. CB3171]|uniref:DUF2066 domain-containing protein n=1 Tax=Rhizobium sp. CB3171 TaxID=3039157 RepID=UPI0024B0D405|nr:DUF2066 domain-containing protein [Rhizobium sp. CB3171]WFU02086.1 DUF2066 domain-containing protein [Rhizobium sp. CB3171]
MLKSRSIAIAFALAVINEAAVAHADDQSRLYRAQAIVTGTGAINRELGFKDCLGRVLVRVSGDQRVTTENAFQAMLQRAGSFVATYSYRDRLEGIPIHDEQGTHDRPQDLTCIYMPDTIDQLLSTLGHKPWLSPRPKLAIFLVVRDAQRTFTLTRDGDESPYMIDAFEAAARPFAMAIIVPNKAMLVSRGLTTTGLAGTAQQELDALAKTIGGDVALAGSLVWSDKDLGWVADWSMMESRKIHHWRIRGVSFDDAFRNAIGGAAQIASGNGEPQ